MTTLPTNRTTANTPAEHVADHDELHRLHDILDGSTTPSVVTAAQVAAKADDSAVVKVTGAQIIAGVKTFASAPVVPAAAFPESAIAGLVADLAARPADASVVKLTTDQTIAGIKTFSSAPVVPAGSFPEAAVTNLVTDLAATVKTTSDQTVNGIKTFSSSPIVPTPTTGGQAVNKTALDAAIAGAVSGGATILSSPGGSDDTALVTAGRATAGTNGTLVFTTGTYVVSGLAASVAGQHWIIQPGATIKTKNGADTPTIDVTANGVTIDGGGTIDGNRANQTSISMGHYGLGTTAGVRIKSRTDTTVTGLYIKDCAGPAVYIDASTRTKITDNRIANCSPADNAKAILVIDVVGNTTGLEIANNQIDALGQNNGGIGFTMQSGTGVASRVRIHDNEILVGQGTGHPDPSTLGIELFTTAGSFITDAVVANNLVAGPSGVVSTDVIYGISCGGNATSTANGNLAITVVGNTIVNCPALAVEVVGSDIAVVGNSIRNCGPISVLAVTTTGGITCNSVTGNTITNGISLSYCIRVHGSTNGISGLVVADNTVRNNASGSVVMLIDGVVSGATITGNSFTACKGPGISIVGTLTDSVIANNVIDLTGVGGSTADGILFASTTIARVAVVGNIIKGAARMGIYGLNACSDVDIRDNRVSNCAGSGVRADAAMTRWSVQNNTIHSNTDRGLIFVVASTLILVSGNRYHSNPNGDEYTVGSTFVSLSAWTGAAIGGSLSVLQSATAPALATSGTITTADTGVARVSPAAAVTLVVLQAGTVAGQIVVVVNEAVAANTVTFDVAATSNVADGAGSALVGLAARHFVWDSGTSRWYRAA